MFLHFSVPQERPRPINFIAVESHNSYFSLVVAAPFAKSILSILSSEYLLEMAGAADADDWIGWISAIKFSAYYTIARHMIFLIASMFMES